MISEGHRKAVPPARRKERKPNLESPPTVRTSRHGKDGCGEIRLAFRRKLFDKEAFYKMVQFEE